MENQIINRKYTKYHSLWFWWIVLTIVYVVGPFLVMMSGLVGLSGLNAILTKYFYSVIGVFVPFGFWSYFGVSFSGHWYLIPIFLTSLYFLEGWLKKLYLSGKISLALKLVAGFIFLLLSTVAADIILWGCWQSMTFTGLVADCVDL